MALLMKLLLIDFDGHTCLALMGHSSYIRVSQGSQHIFDAAKPKL